MIFLSINIDQNTKPGEQLFVVQSLDQHEQVLLPFGLTASNSPQPAVSKSSQCPTTEKQRHKWSTSGTQLKQEAIRTPSRRHDTLPSLFVLQLVWQDSAHHPFPTHHITGIVPMQMRFIQQDCLPCLIKSQRELTNN